MKLRRRCAEEERSEAQAEVDRSSNGLDSRIDAHGSCDLDDARGRDRDDLPRGRGLLRALARARCFRNS